MKEAAMTVYEVITSTFIGRDQEISQENFSEYPKLQTRYKSGTRRKYQHINKHSFPSGVIL
jgi:pantothenate synthetase